MANQYLHTTVSPEVALYYAEAFNKDSKHQIVEIDLRNFTGDVIDVSHVQACHQHGLKQGTKAYNLAVRHEVVLLTGYVQPSLLGEGALHTSGLIPQASKKWSSCADFTSELTSRTRSQLNNWRRASPSGFCAKPEPHLLQPQAVRNDDAIQGAVLEQAAAKLAADIAKLQARKSLLDSMARQIQDRIDQEDRRKEEERLHKLEEERREQQRQEELERKREKEKRRKEARREEQRRKQAEWQAEEDRGPKIWALCGDVQEHLLRNFDRQALHVALGNDGYIALWDRVKGHAWKDIPKALSDKLNGRGYHQSHATLAALSPDSSSYFVQFSDGTSQWRGPEGFAEALQQYSDSARPAVVALGPQNSWFVQWDDGSWQHEGLPKSLRNMLNSNRHRSVAFLSVSGLGFLESADEAAWFIRWEDDKHPEWKMTEAPASLLEKVQEIQAEDYRVRSVEFGSYGEWVLRYAD